MYTTWRHTPDLQRGLVMHRTDKPSIEVKRNAGPVVLPLDGRARQSLRLARASTVILNYHWLPLAVHRLSLLTYGDLHSDVAVIAAIFYRNDRVAPS